LEAEAKTPFPAKFSKIVTSIKKGRVGHEGKSEKSDGHWDRLHDPTDSG
jgi:hypothetical protein